MFTRAPHGGCASTPTETLARQTARVCAGRAPSSSRRRTFEERRLALTHAHAHRRQPVAPAAAAELVEQRHDEARPSHPERVPERNRTAVDVHLFGIQPQLADHHGALRSEGLVQLDQVDLVTLDAGTSQRLAHGRDRPDPHHAWVDTGNASAHERTERLRAERLRLLLRGDHYRSGAVVDPGRVAGCDRAAFAEGGLQRCQLRLGCVRPRMLVALGLPYRDELVRETPRLVGRSPALLRLQTESILLLARDPVALRHVLPGLAHRLEREELLQARVREAPPERRVIDRSIAAGKPVLRL